MVKIGIIVYSQTDNTFFVAKKLQEGLKDSEHEVKLERVTPRGDVNPGSKDIEFENQPDVDEFDALIFGSPVQAFSLAAPMKSYLNQIPTLAGKNIACFVTKGLPFHRTGGNQAIGQMRKICQLKGGDVISTGIIVWRGGKEKEINELVEKFNRLFS